MPLLTSWKQFEGLHIQNERMGEKCIKKYKNYKYDDNLRKILFEINKVRNCFDTPTFKSLSNGPFFLCEGSFNLFDECQLLTLLSL